MIQQSPTDPSGAHVPITDEVIRYVQRYQGSCRDCADEAGYCPYTGIACGDREKAIRHVLGAINYGVSHGYLSLSQAAQPAEADGVEPITRELLGEVMQDAWSDICGDSGSHPLDMRHGRGTILFYQPNHWTDMIAMLLNQRLAATPKAPATDGGECVGFWTTHPDYPGEFSEIDITDGDRAAGWKSQPLYVATPPAPNDDMRAALEKIAAGMPQTLSDGTELRVPLQAGASRHIARAALKENRRG